MEEPCGVSRQVVTDSRYFDEDADPDPHKKTGSVDPHYSEADKLEFND